MEDDFAIGAEFYDLHMRQLWNVLAPQLTSILADIDPSAGPILDIGAGTGSGTLLALDAIPHGQVVAIEPSRAMRTALFAKLAARPDDFHRVTVHGSDLAAAVLPGRLAGALAINMIGSLDPNERRDLWTSLAQRLAPGAPLVIVLQRPYEAAVVPYARAAVARVGARTYEGWLNAWPIGDDLIRWRYQRRILEEGRLLEERTFEYDKWTAGPVTVIAELAAQGLVATCSDTGLVLARLASTVR